MVDMLGYDDFVKVINQYGTDNQKSLLGTAHTDWNDEVYRTAFGTDNNLSLSGSIGKFLPFRASVGYYNQSGLVRKDNVERWTGNIVLTPSFFQDHLKLTINAKGTLNNNSFNAGGAVWAAATYNPTLPVYSGNSNYGGYNEALDADGYPVNAGVRNPRGIVDQYDSKSKVSRFIGSMDVDYKVHFLPDLKLHATLGADYAKGDGTVYVPVEAASAFNKDASLSGNDYKYGPQKNENRLLTLYANYAKYFENIKSNVDLTAGYDYQYWKSSTPEYFTKSAAGTVLSTVKASDYRHVLLSYYGRVNYSFDGKYLLTATVRRDASSRFSKDNRWGTFPSVALGWTLTQEPWLKDSKVVSNLKLRASYAEMGSQSGIDNYDGYQFYNLNTTSGAYVGSDRLTTITTNGKFASTTRQWERIKNYNIALDFGFFNGALSGTVEGFLKKNDNMLVAITYPAILGDAAPTANSGKFKDWGFEGSINYNGKIGEVQYHVGGNITFARNELTDYGGTSVLKSGYTSTQQGYSLNSIFGLRYGGKIQNEEMLKAYLAKYYPNNGIGMPSNLRVGDNMYCDENGDGVLDYRDYIYLGSDTPEISYSFNAGASWKGIDFNIVFQGSANRFVYRGIDAWTVPFRSLYTNSTTSSIGNTWSETNPNAYYNPYTTDANIVSYNYQANSLTAQDGRYIRLKNITVGYNLPASVLKKLGFVNAARIYFTGEDLWESTKITDGWDPEAKRNASDVSRYPFTRNFTFGLNLTF